MIQWGLVFVSLLVLSGCGNKQSKGKEEKETEKVDVSAFPIVTANTDQAIAGGTLAVGMVTDSPIKGVLVAELYQDGYDSSLMEPVNESIFTADENFTITDDGVVKLDLDVEAKTATLTIQKEAVWSDGVPVTADDLIFPYELIGHKDYPGVRYTDELQNIVGIEEYHAEESETISGISKIDDQTITIEYKEVNPAHLQYGGPIWSSAAPKHYLKDIPVKDIESAPEVRSKPLHFGPYAVDKITTGEAVTYIPNEYYYQDKPKLDKIVISVLPPASAIEALKSQKYDMVLSMTTDNYDVFSKVANYEYLGRQEYAYTYMGFKLGKWDEEKKQVETDDSSKMANKNLRQAMGYAVSNDDVAEKFYHGIRSRATTLIPTVYPDFHDDDVEGYPQDKEKAKKLLADAGYVDTNDDGFVEDPDGNELVINFASMSGGETAQPLADYYIQEWADVGLNVQLTTGRLIDFQSFYDKLENDDPEIDIYQGAWGTGADPNPSSLYGRTASYNFSRFSSAENDRLLAEISSSKSFDKDFRKNAFNEWQEYVNEEAFVIPSLYRNEILPVHERVTNWDWNHQNLQRWNNVGVSRESRK